MQLKHLGLLAIAGLASAQNSSMDLNTTLINTPELSNLTRLLALNPTLLSTLYSAKNVTILAPTNQAFSKFLQNMNDPSAEKLMANPGLVTALLEYHVLNGTYRAADITNNASFVPSLLTNQTYANVTGGQVVECMKVGDNVTFNGGLGSNATVEQADVMFTGGVVHVIDSVLSIPDSVLTTALEADLIAAYGAINATNLESAVSMRDTTVFVPTNAAFLAISSVIDTLSVDDLTRVLEYHVVNGTVGYSSALENGTMLQTALGQNLTITINNGSIYVNSAQVVVPNILVGNGVVHVIDNVLNPSDSMGPSMNATMGAPAYSATASGTNVPFTSGQPTPTTHIVVTPTSAGAAGSTGKSSGSKSGAAAMPLQTGAFGVAGKAALFGVAAGVFLG